MASQQSVLLYPSSHPHDLGPQRIDIFLFPAAANGGGHALRVSLPVAAAGGLERLLLAHPIREGPPARLAPGTIELESLQGSTLNLLCLGGSARFASTADMSTCCLESTAPLVLIGKSIFDDDLDPIDLFCNELEAWLSIMRARARGDDDAFGRLLVDLPPFVLYAQGLLLAVRRLGQIPVDERDERYWRSHNVLHSALTAATQRPQWPGQLPDLEALLDVHPHK